MKITAANSHGWTELAGRAYWLSSLLIVVVVFACPELLRAYAAQAAPPAEPSSSASAPRPDSHAVVLDRIVADVNGQAILASDVDDEIRFTDLQAGSDVVEENSPKDALDRVIDRTLIDQQRALQPGVAEASAKEVDQAIAELQSEIPACARFDCKTETGWQEFLVSQGFTPAEIENRIRERLEILKFINVRFGVVAQVSGREIRQYYDQVLVPKLKENHQPVPEFSTVFARIREVLRQQQIDALMDSWVKGLRAEGQVQTLDPRLEEQDDGQ